MNKQIPVALVTGVGPGTGAAIARRFAQAGYGPQREKHWKSDTHPLFKRERWSTRWSTGDSCTS
jgi:hypothetical protein